MPAITLRNVKKSYGRNEVVHGVNFEAQPGEFIVILGPSGCGKSTLLRMVAGLEAVTAGDIEIGGRLVNRLEPRERGCAMVFQNYALYPHMTVAQNIGYALKIARVPRAERDKRVHDVATALGLTEFLARKPGQLSGGQRQRVAMGRAMIREPQVFLYDEPLSNLDAKLRVAMRVEIRRLHQKLGTTTLFVTHDQVEAMTLADRIVVMNKGEIEQVGTPSEVYHAPQSTYVASFIGAPGMNLLPASHDGAGGLMLPGGHRIAAGHAPRDTDIHVGVRAEAIELASPGKGIPATVQFVEELGPSRLLHVDLGGASIVVASRNMDMVVPGTELFLAIDPSSVHYFASESGQRIELAL